MKKFITNFIKDRPRVYDLINNRRNSHGELGAWLRDLPAKIGEPVSFMQVGASDGLRWDPLRKHVVTGRWNGLFVEALPDVFDILRSNYSYLGGSSIQDLKFANAAVSDQSGGCVTFWTYSEEILSGLPLWKRLYWLRQSSLDKEVAQRVVRNNAPEVDPARAIIGVDIAVRTVSDLLNEHWEGKAVDLIFIDAEGMDDHVIYGIDMQLHQPTAVVFESNSLGQERNQALSHYLESEGYQLRFLGGDTIAMLVCKT